jgi:hypothetical protein
VHYLLRHNTEQKNSPLQVHDFTGLVLQTATPPSADNQPKQRRRRLRPTRPVRACVHGRLFCALTDPGATPSRRRGGAQVLLPPTALPNSYRCESGGESCETEGAGRESPDSLGQHLPKDSEDMSESVDPRKAQPIDCRQYRVGNTNVVLRGAATVRTPATKASLDTMRLDGSDFNLQSTTRIRNPLLPWPPLLQRR